MRLVTRAFRLRATTVHERFGDESVIVNLDTGSYYSAQGTGDVIWTLVTEGASEAEILRRIAAEYIGDRDELSSATAKFLTELADETLVDVVDEDVAGTPTVDLIDRPTKVFAAPFLQKYTDMEELLQLDPIHEVDEIGWPSARKAPA
jgi:hypothetical protein